MGRKPGPHSRADKRLVADRRLAPARRARRHIEDLTEHIGGHPTATQRLLIERTAMVLVRLSYLDEKILSGMDLTDYDNRTYLAWANTARHNLSALGLHDRSGDQPQTIEQLVAQVAASKT